MCTFSSVYMELVFGTPVAGDRKWHDFIEGEVSDVCACVCVLHDIVKACLCAWRMCGMKIKFVHVKVILKTFCYVSELPGTIFSVMNFTELHLKQMFVIHTLRD